MNATHPLLSALIGRKPPTVEVMDIGAMPEGTDRYQLLVAQGLARVTGFEPNPIHAQALNERQGPYTYHPVFLGDGRAATFHITRFPGCCSLLEPDPAVIEMFSGIGAVEPDGNFTVMATETVQTHRLDEVEGLAPPDMIKIDVQGAELIVLENGPRTLSSALVVEIEAEFVALYKTQPLFGDIQRFMAERGFVLHKFLDMAGRCFRPIRLPNPCQPMSQLLWADAIFVRDFGRLEAYGDDELLKAALILTDVYGSFDLAAKLLVEHDRRTGGDIGAAYLRNLANLEVIPCQFLSQRLVP